MKTKSVFFCSLLLTGSFLSAQMPGMMTMQTSAPQGTTLGANTTSGAAGIALGNRVVMRGYVDFIFQYEDGMSEGPGLDGVLGTADDKMGTSQNESFSTAADVDFLFDFSPVTAELHLDLDGSTLLEQAFGRYNINRDFNISFGRQLTSLGYEADEAPGLFSVTNAYYLDNLLKSTSTLKSAGIDVKTRRNYKDGVRANFNNGRFGLTFGLHDGYWGNDDFNGDNIAIDLAASLMIMPGLEARIGYAQEEIQSIDDDVSQFNAWIAYNPNDLTLAFEYDNFDISTVDYWSMLLLANYQFNDFFGATFKYSHEDIEDGSTDNADADRFTFALLFTVTQNLFFNVEYSHSEVDTSGDDYDVDEFYLEALLTF